MLIWPGLIIVQLDCEYPLTTRPPLLTASASAAACQLLYIYSLIPFSYVVINWSDCYVGQSFSCIAPLLCQQKPKGRRRICSRRQADTSRSGSPHRPPEQYRKLLRPRRWFQLSSYVSYLSKSKRWGDQTNWAKHKQPSHHLLITA